MYFLSDDNYEMNEMDRYIDPQPQQSVFFLPRRFVNCNKNEIMRGLRFTGKTAEYLSFIVPKRQQVYTEDLYKPYITIQPSLNFDQWARGMNKDPILKPFDPVVLKEDNPDFKRDSNLDILSGSTKMFNSNQ